MAPIQVSLTDQEFTALERLAAEQHVSVLELAHKMVVSGLQKPASRWTPERKRRALAAVGRFSSECRDVSVRHDDYLAEAYGK